MQGILHRTSSPFGPGSPEHKALAHRRVARCSQGTCPASLLIVPVLCPNLAPTPSCRHSDQGRDGISAAPHAMCFGSASQEDVPPLPCGRGGSPWARSRNLVSETSNAGPPCCHLAGALQPRFRMDHSSPPHAGSAWSGTHHVDVLGMDSVMSPFPASGVGCHGVDSRGFR